MHGGGCYRFMGRDEAEDASREAERHGTWQSIGLRKEGRAQCSKAGHSAARQGTVRPILMYPDLVEKCMLSDEQIMERFKLHGSKRSRGHLNNRTLIIELFFAISTAYQWAPVLSSTHASELAIRLVSL